MSKEKKKQQITKGIYGIGPVKILQDKRVTFNELKAFIAIASFQGIKDAAFPSREEIAERAGLKSVQAVSRATKGLLAKGWITRTRRYGRSSVYRCSEPATISLLPVRKRRPKSSNLAQSPNRAGQLIIPFDRTTDRPNESDIHRPIGSDDECPNGSDNSNKRPYKKPELKDQKEITPSSRPDPVPDMIAALTAFQAQRSFTPKLRLDERPRTMAEAFRGVA